MEPLDPVIQEICDKCAWCLRDLSQLQPYMLLAKLPLGYPMKSGVILLPVALPTYGKIVHAIVMQPGSEGKQKGYDLMFGLCSEKCAISLKKAMEEERTGFLLSN